MAAAPTASPRRSRSMVSQIFSLQYQKTSARGIPLKVEPAHIVYAPMSSKYIHSPTCNSGSRASCKMQSSPSQVGPHTDDENSTASSSVLGTFASTVAWSYISELNDPYTPSLT